jgi:ParB family chromosome partitioning protein
MTIIKSKQMFSTKKRGLGKGLKELGIQELLSDIQPQSDKTHQQQLPIELIHPGKFQPRKDFNPETLQQLADSIRSQGIIQPIIVRTLSANQYEIIAGERRWRAAQIAKLETVPVVIRDVSDDAAIAMALIENIQREDLNVIEEATALLRFIDEFNLTHEQIADLVGKARATVTNLLRLLDLNKDVQKLLAQKKLEMGHARALLTLPNKQQLQIANIVAEKQLSVRETERLVQRSQTSKTSKKPQHQSAEIIRLQRDLSDKLGAAVIIQHQTNGKGKLIIQYNSVDELEGILEKIK